MCNNDVYLRSSLRYSRSEVKIKKYFVLLSLNRIFETVSKILTLTYGLPPSHLGNSNNKFDCSRFVVGSEVKTKEFILYFSRLIVL